MRYSIIPFLLLLLAAPAIHADAAQVTAPCGVVDAIDYPVDNLVPGYDDFTLYRARFGGNHTGVDIAFDRWGDPVHAAARGRVTYSNPEGWDTEKGVVILEHTFPDGSIAYSLYGHVEQTDKIFLPQVGKCVARGEIIAAVGWPSRGRPHLHFEWRNFMPDDGGPGYVTDNPMSHGWYNPLDFTALWRIKLLPAFIRSVTFDTVPTLPPVRLESGGYAVANADSVNGMSPDGKTQWRVTTDGVVTGIAGLAGDRVVAHTSTGQAMTLQNGRYNAVWAFPGADDPFLTFGEKLVFAGQNGAIAAFDPAGTPLWSLPGNLPGRVIYYGRNGGQIALAVQGDSGVIWRLADENGALIGDTNLSELSAAAPLPDGSWMLLEGPNLHHLSGANDQMVAAVSPPPGRNARIAADAAGDTYIYLGDSDSTLLAVSMDGSLRWRVTYPYPDNPLAPLVDVGGGCLLYSLDADGIMNVFSTANGKLVNQVQLYAGGARSNSPNARLLRADPLDGLEFEGGFQSMVTLDGAKLGGDALAACQPG
ncbi:MAG: peptidoglycan DD-metalloendopeptidase family protein [Chloroflexota bacterium]